MATEADSLRDTVKDQLPNLAEKLEVLGDVLVEALRETNPLIDVVMKGIGVILRDLGLAWELGDAGAADEQDGEPPVNPFDEIRSRLDGFDAALGELGSRLKGVQREAANIEAKNDKLGELLGRTLVGEAWVVDPTTTVTGPPKVPPIAVKEEMHGIERALAALQALLDGNAVGPAGGLPPVGPRANPNPGAAPGGGAVPRPWPPQGPFIAEDEDPPIVLPPADPPPIPRLDPRLKRIYVYEQGVFAPAAAGERRVVRVRTKAFDLSGWLDLTALRPGDVVTTEILVSVAGRRHRLFRRTAFGTPGLKSFADMASGTNYISGDDVRIVLRQDASADGFAAPIDIPYQFVVESRD